MRRCLAVLLLVAACSGEGERDAARTTSTRPAPTTTEPAPRSVEVRTSAECPGIGPAPEPAEPVLTWVADGRLHAQAVDGRTDARCLAHVGDPGALAWGGLGDRVLVGRDVLLLADGARPVDADVDRVEGWSAPTGRAVLGIVPDAGLVKVSLDGSPRVTFPTGTSVAEAAYHPSGTAVVSVVVTPDGPQVLRTDNVGNDPSWLSRNEDATAIRDLTFDYFGNLLFVAEHDGQHHVHRVSLDATGFETVVRGDGWRSVVASPWRAEVAAARGSCDDSQPLWAQGWREQPVGEPLGWLPDGGLVVLRRPACGAPGDLLVAHDGVDRVVARDVSAAAVRAVLPPPPPTPPELVGSGFA